MKNSEIHIRDPFVYCDGEKYYMYGTRGANFGCGTGGFDVYISTDLENWEGPKQIFDSAKYGLNKSSNWAPEMHRYRGRYYIFATFFQDNDNRGTYSLVCDTPDGEFVPCSCGALTPHDWHSLDGTLFVDDDGKPWLVFCHEHVQIMNGTVCAVPLSDDLSRAAGEPELLFYGSEAYGRGIDAGGRYVTDGPFLYRGKGGRLYMIWSTCSDGYKQCLCVSGNGKVNGKWTQLENIFENDGGHGMIFTDLDGRLRLTLHKPNCQPCERPAFFYIDDNGSSLVINNNERSLENGTQIK